MADTSCITDSKGLQCPTPSDWKTCRPWSITDQPKLNCYADALANEALAIAGATINVYKLLGVHEQTKLIDLTGNGVAISGGAQPGFSPSNAFDKLTHTWRSLQTDSTGVLASTYIGYDFGVVKLPSGREKYGIPASVRYEITTVKIKQSSDASKRATKVRVERSDNGTQWYGVAVLTLPDDDALNTVHFKHSVPNRYWRLRPTSFNGSTCGGWEVQALEMHEHSVTHESNIQDKILLENRDRDYAEAPIGLKGYYDLVNVSSSLSRFGIEIPTSTYQIKINFNACIASLGRPVVVGDIVELPSEVQYTPTLTPVKRWLEVTDVTWDAGSYTPGWVPTMLLITVKPAMASQETQDIFGDLAKKIDTSGLVSIDDGNHKMFQDISAIDQTIRESSLTMVPERGSEGSNVIREFTPEDVKLQPRVQNMSFFRTGTYVEDAMPQNGEQYTEGSDFPQTPANGNYHRLTYEGTASDVPARLYRWSAAKNRWIYLETDRRAEHNSQKGRLEEYVSSPSKKSARDIG